MNKGLSQNLSEGIILENSKTLIPWKTTLSNLKNYGNPNTRNIPGKEIIMWKNETILNGLTVDLNVTFDTDFLGRNKKLKNISAYISEGDFEKARIHLDLELEQIGEYKKLNRQEFEYIWRTDTCEVSLTQVERFGTYYKLEIKHKVYLSHSLKGMQFTLPDNSFMKPESGGNCAMDLLLGNFRRRSALS